jgi:hypothetical protein
MASKRAVVISGRKLREVKILPFSTSENLLHLVQPGK